MRTNRSQRGFLLIAAIVLIAVAATMAVVILTLTAGSGQAGGLHASSAQAFFIAESGIERGIHRYALDNTYAGETTAFGGGTYTVSIAADDFQGLPLSIDRRRVRSTGQTGSNPAASRTVDAIVRFGATLFNEPFTSLVGWSQVLTSTEGSSSMGADCPGATCPGASGGSLLIQTTPTGPNDRLTGYRQRNLPTDIATGAGVTVDVQVAYRKASDNGNARASSIEVILYDTLNQPTVLWSNADPVTAGWVLDTVSVALPAGRTYNRIRVAFDLHEQGNSPLQANVDEIRITAGSGAVREAWREVFP